MKSDEKLVIQIEKNETLGDFIQKCRQQYGWTQEELGWRTGITREHVGRIERGKCVPSVQTLYDLEKALNLPECSLVKRVNGQAEADVSQESEEKQQVGRACRELELALVANLTKSNLRKASDAISTIAKMLNDTEMFSKKKIICKMSLKK
jgi:DNA-binding helix-turn-helix protein